MNEAMMPPEEDTTTTNSSTRPWIERYRPKSLDEVSHQQEVVATLQNATKTGRLPHLLFYGPPGSGKVNLTINVHKCIHKIKKKQPKENVES